MSDASAIDAGRPDRMPCRRVFSIHDKPNVFPIASDFSGSEVGLVIRQAFKFNRTFFLFACVGCGAGGAPSGKVRVTRSVICPDNCTIREKRAGDDNIGHLLPRYFDEDKGEGIVFRKRPF